MEINSALAHPQDLFTKLCITSNSVSGSHKTANLDIKQVLFVFAMTLVLVVLVLPFLLMDPFK